MQAKHFLPEGGLKQARWVQCRGAEDHLLSRLAPRPGRPPPVLMPCHPNFKNVVFSLLFYLFTGFSLTGLLHHSPFLWVLRVVFSSASASCSTSGFSPIARVLQVAVFEVVPTQTQPLPSLYSVITGAHKAVTAGIYHFQVEILLAK